MFTLAMDGDLKGLGFIIMLVGLATNLFVVFNCFWKNKATEYVRPPEVNMTERYSTVYFPNDEFEPKTKKEHEFFTTNLWVKIERGKNMVGVQLEPNVEILTERQYLVETAIEKAEVAIEESKKLK